ncbi:MAG: FxsA family protein [Alphaproteobacteria bacterium]|nr:FxsA family protein [Alphaproteobacteria bacterium]
MQHLFFILILIPFVEIFTFIKVGQLIGAMTAISITIVSAIIGIYLVKQEANNEQIKAIKKMNSGKAPVKEAISGLYLLIAGILLLIPGLVSDFIGVILLIPIFRNYFIKNTISRLNSEINTKTERTTIIINGKNFKHKYHKDYVDAEFSEKNHHNDN